MGGIRVVKRNAEDGFSCNLSQNFQVNNTVFWK